MKPVLLQILVLLALQSFAQKAVPAKTATGNTQYSVNAMEISKPPYGLTKIKALISKIIIGDNKNKALDDTTYQALSLPEKFTYNLINAEVYAKAPSPTRVAADVQTRIFAQLPKAFGDYEWSERQKNFFKENIDSVTLLLMECIFNTKRIGLNFRQAILEINAKDIIPQIINVYTDDGKDHDLLTLLMLLMKNGNYVEFTYSPTYKVLYGSEDSNGRSSVQYDPYIEQLIITRALKYSNASAN